MPDCTIYFVQDSSESSEVFDEECRQQHDREQYYSICIYKDSKLLADVSHVLVCMTGLRQKLRPGMCGLDFLWR